MGCETSGKSRVMYRPMHEAHSGPACFERVRISVYQVTISLPFSALSICHRQNLKDIKSLLQRSDRTRSRQNNMRRTIRKAIAIAVGSSWRVDRPVRTRFQERSPASGREGNRGSLTTNSGGKNILER